MGQVVRGGFSIFLYFLFGFVWLFLAYEYLCTVGVWHIILVVHIHSLAAIVVLLSENALYVMQSILCSLSLSIVVKKHTEE